MASKRTKIAALAAIWIAVGGMGWHAFTNVLPKYGLISRPARSNQAGREEWQKAQKEQQAFFKEPVPGRIVMKVNRVKPDQRTPGMSRTATERGGFYAYFTNQSVAEIYCRLKNLDRWQVSEQSGADARWSVRIRAPQSMRGQVADSFLEYLHWTARQQTMARESIRLTEGSPPANPDTGAGANAPGGGRGGGGRGTFPISELRNIRGFLEGRYNGPIEIDKAVEKRKPAAELKLNWSLDGRKFVDSVAAQYGVAVQTTIGETTSVLVYHPKYIQQADLTRWSRDGKL